MGNSTTSDLKTEIYVKLDDNDVYVTNNTENTTEYVSGLLERLMYENSSQYNCFVEKTKTKGFFVFGFPKNEPVLYPRLLHTLTVI